MRIAIIGAGDVGVYLASRFSERGDDVVLIERDPSVLASAEETLDVMTLVGDATYRSVLSKAEVERASAVVAVTNSGPINMLAAALGKTLGARVAVARVDSPGFYVSPAGVESGILGVDYVLCATRLATTQILNLVLGERLPFVANFGSHRLRVALVPIDEHSTFLGRQPGGVRVGGLAVPAVVRGGFLRRSAELSRLEAGDQLLVAAPADELLDAWRELLGREKPRRALIVGGGDTGAQLARALAGRIDRVELIEVDRLRAEELSTEIPDATVVVGDARNAALLQDLQISSVDHLVAVTRQDETNLMVSLLGKQLGVPHAYTLMHRPGYTDLFSRLGVGGSVGTYQMLYRSVVEAIVDSGRVRLQPLPGTSYSLIEWRLPKAAKGKKAWTQDLEGLLPQRALVLAATRGHDEILIGGAATEVQAGDTLVLVCPTREEKELAAALERASARTVK